VKGDDEALGSVMLFPRLLWLPRQLVLRHFAECLLFPLDPGLAGALYRLRFRCGPEADSSLVRGRVDLGGAAPRMGAPGLVM